MGAGESFFFLCTPAAVSPVLPVVCSVPNLSCSALVASGASSAIFKGAPFYYPVAIAGDAKEKVLHLCIKEILATPSIFS